MYCIYRNSSWHIHGGLLYVGCPVLRGSIIGGPTLFLNRCLDWYVKEKFGNSCKYVYVFCDSFLMLHGPITT